MRRNNHSDYARRWAALATLLAVLLLGLTVRATPNGGNGALADSPGLSPAPRTGPPSAFRPLGPLDDPAFGPNYRANTDPSPTLQQREPSIAVNPTNPLNVVTAANDFRDSPSFHVWIYTSTDGGLSWINQPFPLNPASPNSCDPVVKFADDGMLFVSVLPLCGGQGDGIQTARSTDGGITFSPAVRVPGSSINSDKPWTWIDNFPSSPYYHNIYTTFMDPPRVNGTVKFTRSTDRGITWSYAQTIGSGYHFPMPIVYPNGDILNIHVVEVPPSLVSERSTDGGLTWGAPQTISPGAPPNCPPDDPNCSIWRLSPIPAIAVNPVNGNSVTTWSDGGDGTAKIRYTRSTDNGATWSASQLLSDPGVPNTYQVEPWVEADENGIFHAIWYDDRENPDTSIFDIYYSQSTDDGATWSAEQRISTATSDLRIGTVGRSAGDYINVTASHGNVYAAWTDTRSGTGEDIYVVHGTHSGTPTPTVNPSPTQQETQIATSTATRTTVPSATSTATSTTTATATSTTTACPVQFSDVPEGSTFYPFVRCLACRGILGGYSDGTFRPGSNVTRGQLAKIVSNAAGWNEPVSGQTFSDVPPGSTFYEYIERAAAHGTIGGYSDGTFRPQNNATRGQISKVVSNAAGWYEPVSGQTFSDVPPGSTFYEYIERMASRGVIGGYSDGTFRPQNNATRGQTSKIVSNAFFPGCQTP